MKHVPALLSFCLPGLGQLAQRRLAIAAGFFICFALSLYARFPVWVLPLIALGAGLEAFRAGPQVTAPDRNLRAMYGAVAAMGLLAWVGYFAVAMLPLEMP